MTTATAPAVEKRKKPWTKARVIDLIIDIFCFVIVGAASLTCILPFIHILAKSLSDNAYVVANRVILLPMSDAGINLDAYNKVFHDPTIMQSLWVTALVTVVFTAIGMFLTVCASYALTRPEFHGRKVFTFMIMFTMYFTAGTIPDYLLMNQLHMLDTIWCLILPLCDLVSAEKLPISHQSIVLDMPACLLVVVTCVLPMLLRQKSSKVQGAVLLVLYIGYLIVLI